MRAMARIAILFNVLLVVSCTDSPQQADATFEPYRRTATYTANVSPVVLVDEAHHNFLNINNRFKPFAQVLLSDGVTVESNKVSFSQQALKNVDILVIANALDKKRSNWQPPFNQALTNEEVTDVVEWVRNGGSLFLIADHAPFPKVIDSLATALGFTFTNGHVKATLFNKATGTLGSHTVSYAESHAHDDSSAKANAEDNPRAKPPNHVELPVFMQESQNGAFTSVLNSQFHTKEVTQVKTFGGAAFLPPEAATSLLTLGPHAVSIEPEVPFEITSSTPRRAIEGWSQGALLELGKGRVAVFSEGMMFSSQIDTRTGKKHGMRSIGAQQNERFLLNVIHWLAG
ncbi:DUF4350 domain-containing protein [Alteromonas stellipolaris]|jgi:hypothetical protein|uniref:DUF4350 domain-containing protein n=1 Tax=Alteromonas stellipolaris TaxID=233316 RepID=UPI002734A3A2|nr:DUF4350 domain-containing protein [Alteromonas stellipolaris]MDP2596105.1 DUF4350 domain-containing protein [Alteromonas stellipolaris]